MISKEERENKDMILAIRIKRVFDYIEDEIKEKGEISQFKEDVLYIIHELLERQLSKDELTACEIVVKNRKAMIQVEKEKRTQEYIQQLENKQQKVIDLIFQYGQIDGEHHKTWVIDQIIRILLEEQYDKWVKEYEEDDYTWKTGIAP